MLVAKNTEALLNLFNQTKKSEAKKYCKNLRIYSNDFALFVLAAQDGVLAPFKYANHFKDRIPEHLQPSNEEISELSKNGVGKLKVKAKKTITKMFQAQDDRRYLAAHLFYTDNYKYWHMFYFDQRDIKDHNNSWVEGPHIHYLSDLWPEHQMPALWHRVLSGDTKFGSAAHIRYVQA